MPYTLDSLPSNVKKLPPKKQRQWLAIFNGAIEDGDDESSAFAQANGVIKDEGKASCPHCGQKYERVKEDDKPAIHDDEEDKDRGRKAGARHSAGDNKMVQTIHDHAVSLGAVCGEMKTITGNHTGRPDPHSNHLKTISETDEELRIANYIILYGSSEQRDLEGLGSQRKNQDGSIGEYFTKATDLESTYTQTGMLYMDWEHGNDDLNQDEILGYVDWKTAKQDEKGTWVERVLNRRNKYVQWLKTLIDSGLVGTSSEPVQSRIAKAVNGHITRWPLKRDTLTVTPMEPRMLNENTLEALKALACDIPCVKNACLKAGLLSNNDLGTKETELSIQANLAYINSVLEV